MACSVTVATDRYHTCDRLKCGSPDSKIAGTRKVISARSGAQPATATVLPSAWNMPEQVKISPLATKFHEMMRR